MPRPHVSSATLTLIYSVKVDTTFGTTKVVTQGASGLDFQLSSGGSCTAAIFADNACTVNVTFAPLAPGTRMGAVQLTDSSGNVLVTTMIHGIGLGPVVAFPPHEKAPFGTYTVPSRVAVALATMSKHDVVGWPQLPRGMVLSPIITKPAVAPVVGAVRVTMAPLSISIMVLG